METQQRHIIPFSGPPSQAFNRHLAWTDSRKARREALCYQRSISPGIAIFRWRDVDFLVGLSGIEASSSPAYPADEDVAIGTWFSLATEWPERYGKEGITSKSSTLDTDM
jgi:hypothetical protein